MPYRNGMPAFRRSEYAVAGQIRNHCKVSCRAVGGKKGSPFDVVTKNGLRIEVKDSKINKRGEWFFNIIRHGVLDESKVDFYVFCLRGLSRVNRVFVVIPAPLKVTAFRISMRTLFTNHAGDIGNWKIIAAAEKSGGKK